MVDKEFWTEYDSTSLLYKYMSYSNYSIEACINHTIWFFRPAAFNGPVDCNFEFEEHIDIEEIEAHSQAFRDNILSLKEALGWTEAKPSAEIDSGFF